MLNSYFPCLTNSWAKQPGRPGSSWAASGRWSAPPRCTGCCRLWGRRRALTSEHNAPEKEILYAGAVKSGEAFHKLFFTPAPGEHASWSPSSSRRQTRFAWSVHAHARVGRPHPPARTGVRARSAPRFSSIPP